jgi:hypothetical protein
VSAGSQFNQLTRDRFVIGLPADQLIRDSFVFGLPDDQLS